MALWTPEYIDTALWLDAADSSTITESGGAVSAWADKSGFSHHATQSIPESKPTISIEAINGKNAVRFSNNSFLSLGTALGKPNGFSFFCVFTVDGSTIRQIPFGSISSGALSATAWGSIEIRSGGTLRLPWSSGTTFANADAQDGVPSLTPVMLYADKPPDDGVFLLNKNGSPMSYTFTSGSNSVINMGEVYEFSIGRWGAYNSLYFTGNVAEFIIAASLGLTDRQKIEGYLAHKWGLTANLPVDHPYKTTAPATYGLSGIISDRTGNPCQRKVYAMSRPTDTTAPQILAHGLSDATTGAYELIVPSVAEVTRIVVSEDSDPLLNDIVDRVIPA